jgi:hypothetical protein
LLITHNNKSALLSQARDIGSVIKLEQSLAQCRSAIVHLSPVSADYHQA